MTDDAAAARESSALRRRVEAAVGAIFEVEEEIGRGGMAVVYRALDRRLRRKVALKVLPPDLAFRADVRSRFLREAQMAAQLSHPHIVPIFAVDETGGMVYFAMGLVEGETLGKQLATNARPDIATVRRVLREVADGLAYAHAQGVVHRDVKPDNILIERASGRALVSDFGIARAAEGDLRLTATGVAVGSPAYMSPEQAMGEQNVDGRADLYALGVVGWQMLAGELPFRAANTPGMLMHHISEPPRPLRALRSDLPGNLIYAIERAMAKSRDDRWADAAAFRDALDAGATVPELPFSNAHTPPRQPGAAKPWRIDPMQDSALDGESGAQALREWREQRKAWRERHKPLVTNEESSLALRERETQKARHAQKTPEDRVRSLQRTMAFWVLLSGFLGAVNMLTSPQFPWFMFPTLAIGIGVMTKLTALWVDGISLRSIFRRQPLRMDHGDAVPGGSSGGGHGPALPGRTVPDLRGLPPEILDGPQGATIREAAEARAVITDVITSLSAQERLNLPDVQATATALEERVRALAGVLHQLDRDASPEARRRLERKLADVRASTLEAPEHDRRITLLERQQATLKDLADRRATVGHQLENAVLLLQTMMLDLLKLRSSGIEANVQDSTMGTQEARAVGRDIERVVDAANEVRRL